MTSKVSKTPDDTFKNIRPYLRYENDRLSIGYDTTMNVFLKNITTEELEYIKSNTQNEFTAKVWSSLMEQAMRISNDITAYMAHLFYSKKLPEIEVVKDKPAKIFTIPHKHYIPPKEKK